MLTEHFDYIAHTAFFGCFRKVYVYVRVNVMIFCALGCGGGGFLPYPLWTSLVLGLICMTLLTQHFDRVAHTAFFSGFGKVFVYVRLG